MKHFISIFIFLACFTAFAQHSEVTVSKITVELPGEADFRYAGIITAQKLGLYKDAGIEVELIFNGRTDEIKSRVAAGQTDFSICGSEIILDRSHGFPLIAVAAFFQRSPNVLMAREVEDLSLDIQKLKGGRILLKNELSVEMKSILTNKDYQLKDFIIEYNQENATARLLAGEVQAAEVSILDNFYRKSQNQKNLRILKPVFYEVEFYDNCLYTSDKFLEENETLVNDFKEATLQGWLKALDKPELAINEIGRMLSLANHDLYYHQAWHVKNTCVMPSLVEVGTMSETKWHKIEAAYKKFGLLAEDFTSNQYYRHTETEKPSVVIKQNPLHLKYIFWSAMAILIIIIVMVFINRRLSRMVGKRTLEIAEVNWQLSKFNEQLENKIHNRTLELEKALQKAEVANKAKSTFLANMTHEIRTPMNSILGFAQIMKEKSKDPDMNKYLDTISSSGQSLLRIINDVLDLSRVEAGKFSLDYSRFNILRLIEEVMGTFSEEIRGKKVSLKFDHSDECPEYIYLDKDRLRQVLVNLVGNAVKFTEEGLIEVKLYIEMVSPKDADITIEVKDTGIGIPIENMGSIFGEFEQADDIHLHYGGTGLGLAIAKQFIEMMNGKLSVESELGRGSDFKFKLSKVGIVDQVDETEATRKMQYYFEPAKVMIIDECQVTLDLFEAYLSVTRLTVKTYKSPFDAVKDLHEYRPDLIITEISMRDLDGFQLAEEIRSEEDFKNIPIIAISSITHTGSRQKFRIFNGFLKKPISVNEFYQSISHFLPCSKVEKKQDVKVANVEAGATQTGEFDFRSFISKETRDKCSSVMKYQVINDYKDLYRTLNQLADDMNSVPLKKWLKEFQDNLDVFNFDALNRQIEYLMKSKDKTRF